MLIHYLSLKFALSGWRRSYFLSFKAMCEDDEKPYLWKIKSQIQTMKYL